VKVSEASLERYVQNPLIFQRWIFLAEKLERSPELFSIPLHNIQRWVNDGRLSDTWALERWKLMIEVAQESEEGMATLLGLLRDDSEESRQLKSCSPFPGVLTREERDLFKCAWTL